MKSPLVSIITVTYNAVSTIEKCILSVNRHKMDDIEFIVIDGASTDGTVNLLEKHNDKIDVWISEPDSGIYDAMNKGLDRASGDYVYFLGGDDILLNIPRGKLGGVDMLFGSVDCGTWKFRHIHPVQRLIERMRYRNAIHPQGTFYRRSNIRYSLEYRFCSDYLYNYDNLTASVEVGYTDASIALFCTQGASAGVAAKMEILRIVKEKNGFPDVMISAAYHLYSWLATQVKRAA